MGVSGGPYIVRDSSLVLELDAADQNSYVSGSTIWNDLSGNNNNGTLSSTGSLLPQYNTLNGGNLVFDGASNYIPFSNAIIPATSNWTYSCFFNFNQLVTGSVLYCQYISIVNNGRFIIRLSDSIQNTTQFSLFLGSGASYSSTSIYTNITANINTNYNLTVVRNNQTYNMYVNGMFDTGSTTAFTASLLQTTPIIGGRTNNGSNPIPIEADFLNGRIYNVSIYNRALSTSEIQQNYTSLKSRFGLT